MVDDILTLTDMSVKRTVAGKFLSPVIDLSRFIRFLEDLSKHSSAMKGTYEIQYRDDTIFNVTEPAEFKELLLNNSHNRIRILDILILDNITTFKLKYDDSSNGCALNYLISSENLESIPVLKEKFSDLKPASSGNRFLYSLMLVLIAFLQVILIVTVFFIAKEPSVGFILISTFTLIILMTLFTFGLPHLSSRYYPALLLLDDRGNIFNGRSAKKLRWPLLTLIVIPIVIGILFRII